MPGYNASQGAFTPTADNVLTLDADTAGDYGKMTKVTWGGELVATTAARTRWMRPNAAQSGAFTDKALGQQGYPVGTARLFPHGLGVGWA